MPNEPRLVAIRDDLIADLGLMTKANGYWFDYAPAKYGAADFQGEGDFARPTPMIEWQGTVPADSITGGELATSRSRQNEVFVVTLAVQSSDNDHERKAWRIRSDVHTALLGGSPSRRIRGQSLTMTFDQATLWSGGGEGVQEGGILGLSYVIRWDHTTGDMSTIS